MVLPGGSARAAPALVRADTVPPDTLAAPSARADTLPADTLPADTTGADTTAHKAPPFPAALEWPDSLGSASVRSWDRDALIAADPQNLLDFLEREMPGVTGLSAGYFAGPFVAMDGEFGPGFVQVIVDGRELDPLEGGTVDLRRVSLIGAERLRVLREAGSLRIEITMISHDRGPAYSRLEAATGRPAVNTVRGVFTNGIGTHVQLAGAGDFLDVAGAPTPAHRLDGWARVGWVSGGGHVGIEVRGRSESVESTVLSDQKFSRSEAYLHFRADLAPWLQADGWAGRSARSPDATSGSGPTTADRRGLVSLTAVPGPFSMRATFEGHTGTLYPRFRGALRSGWSLKSWLHADAGASWSSWTRFRTHSGRAGLAVKPRTAGAVGLTLRGSAVAGTRGVPYPLQGTAESVGFDALDGTATLQLGPYTLEGRGIWQKLSRQLPLGFAFDTTLGPTQGSTVGGFEGRVHGPPIPAGVLRDHLEVSGVWRHLGRLSGASLRYVPPDLAYGEVAVHGDLFQNNLHVTAALGASYRAAMATSRPQQSGAGFLPARTLALGRVEIRIERFRFWWVGHDLGLIDEGDIVGLPHPLGVNLVGVSWEWSN